jgi:hypothetical protein
MNEDLNDKDVLLVKDKGSGELKVAAVDKDGKVKTVKPEDGENPDFLKVNRQGSILGNFYENFKRQYKNPSEFEFFRVPADMVKEVIPKLLGAFKSPDKPKSRAVIDMYRIEPETLFKKQEQTPEQSKTQTQPKTEGDTKSHLIASDRVDWAQLERIGVNRETLEKAGELDRLLNRQKTNLLPITVKTDDVSIRTDARLALREQPDGTLSVSVHTVRKEPELERPYFGVKFTDEDKQNLLKTGNLGRLAEAEYTQGEKTPVFISIDKQTNELVAFRQEHVKIPESIKNVELNAQQKQDLSEGKAVWIEGMTSKKGTDFSAFVQINADRRSFEFRFDNDRQPSQSQKNGENNDVPKTFRKKELSEEQRDSLREGKTVHIDGLVDKQGKGYSGYITFNKEAGKTDFMFTKQYKDALAAGKVIPDDRHKTQVAVNSEGKTNEATKNAKEPLKQGQTQPTEKQAEKQETEKPKKSQSRKI